MTSKLSNHFLDALPVAVRHHLEELAVPKDFPPGMILFQEGAEHDDIYLITSGRVRLEMYVRDRGRLPLMTVAAGEIVGWSPLFSHQRMTATAMAMEPVQTLAFDGHALRRLCDADHEVGYHVMTQLVRVLSDRLLATRLQLLDLFSEHRPSPIQPVDSEC
jgi:CRP/FNR family transcriptional regulator, cyclic AMP receptor protein